ncbi:MAG TPA: T9SS type A sorting domain-containing protein [Flavobacteriales bacterium]|nr:T9SS type A sorting domain-containing protein [Flavobacteriales bacterium]
MKKHFLLVIVLACISPLTKAATCTSINNGDFNNPANWSCGHVPTCGDIVYIQDLITVTATYDLADCASPVQIIVQAGGTLHFDSGRKLKLPCGSGFEIEAGGALTADGYTGSSESLTICGTVVWKASDGPKGGGTSYGSTLPIELLAFNAVKNNAHVDVTWKTATETNNDYFTIERSKDGDLWATIALVDGAGNSSQVIEYMDADYSPLKGTSYYRLKQTDYDGNSSYSQVAVVHNTDGTEANITAFPNPTDGNSFNLEFTGFGDEEVLVVVRDIRGREYYSHVYLVVNHSNIVALPLENKLAAGVYLVVASSDEKMVTSKVTVQ